jgi:hypothetical protein
MDSVANATMTVAHAAISAVTTAAGLGAAAEFTTDSGPGGASGPGAVTTGSGIGAPIVVTESMATGTQISDCFTTFDGAFSTETGCVWFTVSLIWGALSIVIILILLFALCCYCCSGSDSDDDQS